MKPNKLVIWLRAAMVLLVVSSAATDLSAAPLAISEYAPVADPIQFSWATHLAFGPGEVEVVSDVRNDRLLYRNSPSETFQVSPINVNGPHSVVYNPFDQLYYVNDTENNRMIAFSDPSSGVIAAQTSTLAGVTLDRPHDVVIDPGTGWLYAINPNTPQVFRFSSLGVNESVLNLNSELTYSRALTFSNGKLYVVGSAAGKVVEVNDFSSGDYDVYTSAGKLQNAPAGSWTTTGLVLNDVEFYDGYWYATSYFAPTFAGGTDFDENKLIRFQDWDDFTLGTWEDISNLLPSAVVPYYLTPGADGLYLATFSQENPGSNDKIYLIASVPEPTSLVLTLFGVLALASRRTRHHRRCSGSA